jgi:RES domain-containing protein
LNFSRDLLDRLGALRPEPWSGKVYRWVFETTPVDKANSRGARWNPPGVSALYTSMRRDVAIAESDYLLSTQPALKRRRSARRVLVTFEVELKAVLRLDKQALHELGIDEEKLIATDDDGNYCRVVGGAVERLGCDGLIVPSARGDGDNLVIYVNQLPYDAVPREVSREFLDTPDSIEL